MANLFNSQVYPISKTDQVTAIPITFARVSKYDGFDQSEPLTDSAGVETRLAPTYISGSNQCDNFPLEVHLRVIFDSVIQPEQKNEDTGAVI